VIDHRQDALDLAERLQSAETPTELMEVATGFYGLARLLDMKAVLLKARTSPSLQAYPVH
jgi:hypothetical protein